MSDKKGKTEELLQGIPVSEGIAIGKVWILTSPWDEVVSYSIPDDKIDREIKRYQRALKEVAQQLVDCKERVCREIGTEEAKIFEAHLAILNDSFFQSDITTAIKDQGKNVEILLKEGIDRFNDSFQKIKSDFFRQRIDDIKDVAMRILNILLQAEAVKFPIKLPSVLVAHSLSPSDTVRIDKDKILGFATELGSKTSHASILARSMGLPAVVGVEKLMKVVRNGDNIILDGNTGIVHINPSNHLIKSYQKRKKQFAVYWKRLSEDIDLPSVTADGVKISLQANVAMTADVSMAVRYKADGIGLFRTELPFLTAGRLLTGDEQFKLYKSVVESMKGKIVTIRTLDLGGDKFLPFQGVEEENNPFMGWRSIRIFLQERDVFKIQLRAILHASHFGKVRVLFPMISSMEEIVEIIHVLEETKDDMRKEGVPFDESITNGIMIEVPSAAILSDRLINFTDHLSIGTNDLIQYTLAVDRNNEKVARFYQPLNPAILNLIQITIWAANQPGKSVSLCGEIAGNPLYTALLLGFGLREFSMSPLMLPEVKERIRVLTIDECEEIARTVLTMVSTTEIETLLWDFHRKADKRQAIPYSEKNGKIKVSN